MLSSRYPVAIHVFHGIFRVLTHVTRCKAKRVRAFIFRLTSVITACKGDNDSKDSVESQPLSDDAGTHIVTARVNFPVDCYPVFGFGATIGIGFVHIIATSAMGKVIDFPRLLVRQRSVSFLLAR